MKGSRLTVEKAKRQLIAAIVLEQNQKDNPVSTETQIVVITRAFRMLERIWKACGPHEVFMMIKSTGTHPKLSEPLNK